MMRFKPYFLLSLLTILIFFVSCDNDSETLILDGIEINGEATRIQINQPVIRNVTSTSFAVDVTFEQLDSNFPIEEVGIVFSASNSLPTLENNAIRADATGLDLLSENLGFEQNGVDPEENYFVRVYVLTAQGVGYGNSIIVTTLTAPDDVIIINEGNFLSGDGTLGTYNSITGVSSQAVFASANGFPIAATIQTAVISGSNLFLVANSPDKVEIANSETFESIAIINSGFLSPFDIAINDNTAYVSNWGTLNFDTFEWEGSYIAIVDLSTNTVVDSLERRDQPQDIELVDDRLYVADVSSNTISVLDVDDNLVDVTTITVPFGPDRIVTDANNDLFVLCRAGAIVKIDTETNQVVRTIEGVSGRGFNEKMVLDQEGTTLYYLSSEFFPSTATSVWSLGVDETSAPTASLIDGNNFYGLGVAANGNIYVGDANAFQGNGTVLIYDQTGSELQTFPSGRGPNGFIFR